MFEVKSERESVATALCFVIGFLFLSTGAYDFVYNGLHLIDLVTLFSIFLILVSLGLAPKFFFTPLNQLLSSSFRLPTLIKSTVQKTFLFAGVSLFLVCFIWQNLSS